MNSRWNTRIASPNASCCGVRRRPRNDCPCSSGAVKCGTPTSHVNSRGAIGDLVRIAVDQRDRALLRHEHAALVDVADDVPRGVDRLERRRAVAGDVDEEGPVRERELDLAIGRAVELVDGAVVEDLRQQDAPGVRAAGIEDAPLRPGAERAECRRAQADHRLQLGRLGRFCGPMVDLRGERRVRQIEDRAFAAPAQLRARAAAARRCRPRTRLSPAAPSPRTGTRGPACSRRRFSC